MNDMFVILSDVWLDNEEVIHDFFFCSVSFYGIFSGVLCLISILAYP